MAHSNRKKLRDSRGGKTRHQASKNNPNRPSANAAARIQELEQFTANRGKSEQSETTIAKKAKRPIMFTSHRRRRVRVLSYLQAEIASGMSMHKRDEQNNSVALTATDTKRISGEIAVLRTRI